MGGLHNPATDTRLRPCPECHTLGEVDGYECGVCCGDGYVWIDESAVDHGNRFIDHSNYDHRCERCAASGGETPVKPHECLMLTILDACQEHGSETVLRHLEDAGVITMTGVSEAGLPTFELVRDAGGETS